MIMTEYKIGKYGNKYPKGVSNGNDSLCFRKWSKMFYRCYEDSYQKEYPTYVGCTVCEEWFDFENFKLWFNEQKKEDSWHLDKDLLVKDNKVYSPHTCCIIPQELNKFDLKTDKLRGDCPIGVYFNKRDFTYQATIKKFGKVVHLGCSKDKNRAFLFYKKAKQDYAKELAKKWFGKVDDKVYNALMKYRVSVSD